VGNISLVTKRNMNPASPLLLNKVGLARRRKTIQRSSK
jgi:hypothetical protein